ncbi:hypothetical protein HOU00_gp185 [Caulobacter phage CcrPW]|uniref:Uncharacterized protein n=1 Tax=Caulobacter phage CcrPW TaxID=2283271 RepID=A0A385EBB7_9CAUD|nr:hypothetical protein HOU00_gp185 [Caulobacter phage CcrPW]AXQ68940.1 hypothetical protein CcrPW_gp401 [Caulobacter phage CcrPW]
MGRPYDHQYYCDTGSRHGEMRCGGCGKPITEGPYRVYKRTKAYDWYYVTFHRACCEDDPQWAKLDAAREASLARDQRLYAAAVRFRDKWQVDDLDDLIERLSPPAEENTHGL